MSAVVVVAGAHPELAGLVAFVRPMAVEVVAVVAGSAADADAAAAGGADRVVWVAVPEGVPPEGVAGSVAAVVAGLAPEVVAGPRSGPERVLLAAAAGALTCPLLSGVTGLTRGAAGQLRVAQSVHSGVTEREVEPLGPVAVCLTPPRVDAAARPDPAPVERVDAAPGPLRVVASDPGVPAPDLTAARRVVVVGRGLASADELPLMTRLAEALGAELAGTRPVTEGEGWLPREACVGLSGVTVTPELYVGVGVSGQLQHTVGMRRAGTVVAINSDPAAPIFGSCDHGLVGDLHMIVPALVRALRR